MIATQFLRSCSVENELALYENVAKTRREGRLKINERDGERVQPTTHRTEPMTRRHVAVGDLGGVLNRESNIDLLA